MTINGTLIVQIGNFIIAYVVLKKLFFKPVIALIRQEDSRLQQLLAAITKTKQTITEQQTMKEMELRNCQHYFSQHRPPLEIAAAPFKGALTQLPLDEAALKNTIEQVQQFIVSKAAQHGS